MLDQPLGLFDDHFGDLDVALRGFVEGRGNDLALDRALHVGDFLGPLVDQQHNQEHFGIIVGDRARNILQQHGFAGARRSDDQRALALAQWRDDIDHPRALVLDGRVERVELELLVGIERGQIVEIDPVADRIGLVEIDLGNPGEREITFAILGCANFSFDRIAGAKAEFANHIGRNVNVVGTRQIIGFGTAQKAEAVVQNLDRAHAHDLGPSLGPDLEDREHQILLAQRRCALDAHFFGHCDEFDGGFLLEVLEMHENGLFLGSGVRKRSNELGRQDAVA